MHVVFRESHGLDEGEAAFDLGQTPADLVVLSFSDSDLGAFAAGYARGQKAGAVLPSLRLASLMALKHPLSVDTYVENTLHAAKGILVRLIGGQSYWSYGLASLADLARKRGIALAVLPADGREDSNLDALSTLPISTLRQLQALCDAGGAVAAQAALAQLALAAGLYASPVLGAKTVPDCGWYAPNQGCIARPDHFGPAPRVAVVFYRSYVTSADLAPIDALMAALSGAGFDPVGLFAPSLKAPGAGEFMRTALAHIAPAAIINATAFSAKGEDGTTPLDHCGAPVFQVALSTARRRDWAASERGLSPADLAMHIVLPEVDGRVFAGLISHKSPQKRDPDLQFSRFAHRADIERISRVVGRIAGWYRLAQTPPPARDVAFILSTYPGRDDQMAHAVGLDVIGSLPPILRAMQGQGYDTPCADNLPARLAAQSQVWPIADYLAALATLPQPLQDAVNTAWGQPEDDPLARAGDFHFPSIRTGRTLIALQPERGDLAARDASYHDLARTPRHSYVAFYLWLQSLAPHAIIHMGAHGTLEWLPGKSVALSDHCWPDALLGNAPVIYPFIVNDPGEAAQAKRRIGAVTLGHMPPPLRASSVPAGLAALERLLDEYSAADGLDPARRTRLIAAIRTAAQDAGVEADLNLAPDAPPAEAITRIDRFVCDIKESQFGDGLHIWGGADGEMANSEMDGLLTALRGARVPAGPAGSPYRGRVDVLPTGRNLFSVDPRAVPSRAAHAQGVKLAEELIRRHLQDAGDYPRGLVLDLWGSATMRTAGEEVAMALHLAGLAPLWDTASGRVTGFEVIPLALLGRPRIDVTLRISGLFRDIFPALGQMFQAGVAALAAREEDPADNPYAQASARVYGPKPGLYGMGMESAMQDYSEAGRNAAGEAWLSAASYAMDASGTITADRAGIEARVRAADTYAHVQDLLETDVLMAPDYAAHEGGFAAAAAHVGSKGAALYHLDSANPNAPRARTVSEELARTLRARAANPDWANGMMRHGFRGAAEITATLDNLAAYAHLTRAVPAHLFDLYHDATLGRDDLTAFMARENPAALAALQSRFAALRDAGLWASRRNSLAAEGERL
jgi:cobaltochelatase CobN